MMVLVVTGAIGSGLSRATRAFQSAGHDVREVQTAKVALELLPAQSFDILVVPVGAPELDAYVAAAQSSPSGFCYVVGLAVADPLPVREAALAAGVDAIIFNRGSDRELAMRVRAAERVIGIERRLRLRVTELEQNLKRFIGADGALTPPPPNAPPNMRHTVLLTNTWRDLESTCTRMCREYLPLEFNPVAGPTPPASETAGAAISLYNVEHDLQVDMAVFAGDASARVLATAFCGGDESMVDDAVITDFMRELANSAMGAMKASFMGEGIRFTSGIPRSTKAAEIMHNLLNSESHRVLAFCTTTGAVVNFLVSTRYKPRLQVKSSALKEGMVLAEDLATPTGTLLARSGTRLTLSAAARIAQLLPNRFIELGEMS